MQAIASFSIAELARRAGIDVELVRSYGSKRLLPGPRRTRGRSGEDAYHQEHLDRLIFIRRALEAGFSLEVLPSLLGIDGGLQTCNDISRLAERERARIRRDIAELERKAEVLSRLLADCPRTGPGRDCSILKTLREPPPAEALPCSRHEQAELRACACEGA